MVRETEKEGGYGGDTRALDNILFVVFKTMKWSFLKHIPKEEIVKSGGNICSGVPQVESPFRSFPC